jgi:hypothetical protein
MEELLSLGEKLAKVGFPTLLVILGAAFYFNKLRLGSDYDAMVKSYEARLAKAEETCAKSATDYERRIVRLENSVDKWQSVAVIAVDTSGKMTENLEALSRKT